MTTQDVETIKTAILAVLTNGVGLTKIKKWLNSEPSPTSYPTSPFGYVEWAGGPRAPEAGAKKVTDNYFIVLINKSGSPDENEKVLMSFYKAAESLLEADSTLGGTTFDSWVINREIQKIPQDNNEIAGLRITLTTWRYA